mmetsp:Transcript_86580/g.258381  ORF Transcript_86580/g.258381 Transcript_86580/m.258381 type:complete len:272 (+) Transcript_86580:1220-2035(+)
MRASSSARRFLFSADWRPSRKTSILSARCPPRKTAQPSCGRATLCASAGSAGTTATSPDSDACARLSPSEPSPRAASMIGAVPAAAASAPPRWCRRPQTMRVRICSQILSGERRAESLLPVAAMAMSKDTSIAACAAPYHCGGTWQWAKALTTTWVACCERAQIWSQASSLRGARAQLKSRCRSRQRSLTRSNCTAAVPPAFVPPGPNTLQISGKSAVSCAPLAAPKAVRARSAMGHLGPRRAATSSGMASLASIRSFSAACWMSSCTLAR